MDAPRYGTPNTAYFASVLARDEPGGPMWALNLMQYREQAEYSDGRPTTLTGVEADDAYVPHESLGAVGASIVFGADVVHQLRGDGTRWDRIGVVRYPTRAAIIEMNMRKDFQEKHAHKEAGMAFTIVVASFPDEVADGASAADADDLVLVQLVEDSSAADLAADVAATRLARFSVEDVMIGDDRRFAEVRYDRISAASADELAARGDLSGGGGYAVVVRPFIDRLLESVNEPVTTR